MTLDETAEKVKEFARKYKQDAFYQRDVSRKQGDMNSFVLFHQGDGFRFAQLKLDGSPVKNLPLLLERSFREGIRKFESVSFVSDVYMKSVSLSEFERVAGESTGVDLGSEFESNPFSNVVEAICCFTVSWSGETRISVSQYVKGDDGSPVYVDDSPSEILDSLQEQGQIIGGTVRNILESFVMACKVSPSQVFLSN